MSATDDQPKRFDEGFRATLADLFRWRRDVRRFRRDPVPERMVLALLEMADLAPSVGLSQPWRFVIVDDPARRAAVRENFVTCNAAALDAEPSDRAAAYARLKLSGLDDAPWQLALFADAATAQGGGLGRATMPETIPYSAVMAVHTVWLAARAAGLGLGWVSILHPCIMPATLDVPVGWMFIGYFCLGWPLHDDDAPELERLGWEHRRATSVLRR